MKDGRNVLEMEKAVKELAKSHEASVKVVKDQKLLEKDFNGNGEDATLLQSLCHQSQHPLSQALREKDFSETLPLDSRRRH